MSLREFVLVTGLRTAEPGKLFTLASGKQSDRYFDARRAALANPHRLGEIADALLLRISREVVAIGAVPTGGLVLLGPVLVLAGLTRTRHPVKGFYVRDAPKSYGTGQQIEGALDLAPPGPVTLIEDTVSTAQSVLPAVELLRQQGREVREVVCVVDRQLGGRDRLAALGVSLRPLFLQDEDGELTEAPV